MKKTSIYFILLVSTFTSYSSNAQEKKITKQKTMTSAAAADFTTTFLVDQTPRQVFDAIRNVRGWWSEEIKGNTANLDDEFTYHFKDVHVSKMKLIEVVPDKKVVWRVLDNYFNFTKHPSEWTGDKIVFDITKEGNKTRLQFTQFGLVPAYECYDVCKDGWTNYIQNSLHSLITTGKGKPNATDKPQTENEKKLGASYK